MARLTEKGLRELHKIVESKFPDTITKGVKDEGLLKAVVNRPELKLFKEYEPYDNIYLKAASLMEGIIRWHMFNDGNKRTGLLAAFVYLQANSRYLAIPLDAVRFTVDIAENTCQDTEYNMFLVHHIADWLRQRSGRGYTSFTLKAFRYVILPVIKLMFLEKIGMKKYVINKLHFWFAVDMNQEYKKEMSNIAKFLTQTIIDTFNAVPAPKMIKTMLKKEFASTKK